MLKSPGIAARQACWLAQQVAEKALKAALCFLQVDFNRTYNLNFLRGLLPRDWSARQQSPSLTELTAWVVEARYPGGWPEPMPEDALRAVETARGVLDAVMADLRNHGFAGGEGT